MLKFAIKSNCFVSPDFRVVQFWSEIKLVMTNRTPASRSYNFVFTRLISDQIELHSVQLPLLIYAVTIFQSINILLGYTARFDASCIFYRLDAILQVASSLLALSNCITSMKFRLNATWFCKFVHMWMISTRDKAKLALQKFFYSIITITMKHIQNANNWNIYCFFSRFFY